MAVVIRALPGGVSAYVAPPAEDGLYLHDRGVRVGSSPAALRAVAEVLVEAAEELERLRKGGGA